MKKIRKTITTDKIISSIKDDEQINKVSFTGGGIKLTIELDSNKLPELGEKFTIELKKVDKDLNEYIEDDDY